MHGDNSNRLPKDPQAELALVLAARAELEAFDAWKAELEAMRGPRPGNAACGDLFERVKHHGYRIARPVLRANNFDREVIDSYVYEAVVHAVRRFDPGMAVRFLTYVGWWIRKGVNECVATAASSPAAARMAYRWERKIRRATAELNARGEQVTLESVALQADLAVERVRSYAAARKMLGAAQMDLSIGTDPTRYLDAAPDTDKEVLENLINQLPDMERQVLQASMDGQTYAEIGRRIGRSRWWACLVGRHAAYTVLRQYLPMTGSDRILPDLSKWHPKSLTNVKKPRILKSAM